VTTESFFVLERDRPREIPSQDPSAFVSEDRAVALQADRGSGRERGGIRREVVGVVAGHPDRSHDWTFDASCISEPAREVDQGRAVGFALPSSSYAVRST
jgi:hypothetical protein